MQYSIFEGNMERLMKKITRIKNKCLKYGCDFHFEEVGEEFRELTDERKNKYTARFVVVDVEGVAVVNGWKFIASVEHTEKGNIIRAACNIEVPERYYTSSPICEHCKSKRFRKDTYIVMNEETGEFKQVGKSCLMDFTHGMSAEGVAAYTALFNELIAGETPNNELPRWERYYNTHEFLQYVVETIRHFGYLKYDPEDAYARTTKSRAEEYYTVAHGGFSGIWDQEHRKALIAEMEVVSFNAEFTDTVQTTEKALEWLSNKPEDNNYFHNLKTVCGLEYTTYKNLGILASLIPAFYRDIEYQVKKEKQAKIERISEYIGNIKERITINIQSFQCVTSWETDFGTTRIYKIVDKDGNIFTWKTGNTIDEDAEIIVGTVKAHNEYKGVKQTEITRCKIVA